MNGYKESLRQYFSVQVKVGFHEVHFLFFGFHTEFTGQTLGA